MKRGLHLKILHRHHGQCDESLQEDLQAGNQAYEERIAALKMFRKTTKQKQKSSTYLTEWKAEHARLEGLAFGYQRSMEDLWSHLITTGPDEASPIYQILSIQEEDKANRGRLAIGLKQQLDDLKDLIAQVSPDLFLQFRQSHAQQWEELKREEVQLRQSLAFCSHAIEEKIRLDGMREEEAAFHADLLDILRQEARGSSGHNHSLDQNENENESGLDEMDVGAAEVIQSYLERLTVLDKAYEEEAQKKEKEKSDFCTSIGIDLSSSSSSSSCSASKGWEVSHHDVFVKIYRKAQLTGMKRQLMLSLLQSELPSHSLDEILLHEEWYRKMKFIQAKYKDSEKDYRVKRQDLLDEARRAVRSYFDNKRQEEENDKLLEEQEMRRYELHKRLAALREEKEKELQDRLAALQSEQATMTAMQEEEMRLMEAERQKKKEVLAQYHQLKQAQLEEQERKKAEQEAAAAEALKTLIEKNRSKVELRAQKFQEKQQEKKLKQEEAQRQEEERIELLNRLAQQASYWNAIQDIKSRLDQATISSKAQEYTPMEAPTRGHFPLQGFVDAKIVKDARFRLVEALRIANIHNSSAARDAVLQFCPRPHLAIHGLI
eukprot:gene3980-4355_t